MEITLLTQLFYFNIVTLILCHLKPAHKAFLLNVICGIGFIIYGFCLIGSTINYVGFGSTNPILYSPNADANSMHYQEVAGYMFAMFGSLFLVISLIKWLGGAQGDDESWYLPGLKPGFGSGTIKGDVGK